MTDPEGMAEEAFAAPAPAAPQIAATAQDYVTQPEPTVGQNSATVAPRRRRRWAVLLVAAVVVLGVGAGVVVWAPWTPPPPVLRPAGLVAGPSSANSIAFHWSRPATGPLPDKYVILGDGMKAQTVRGTVTSYQQAGLTPGTSYLYSVVAVRDRKRSPQSTALTVTTLSPPMSEARLQGSWQVYVKNIAGAPPKDSGYMTWQFTPACALGACDVMLHATTTNWSFKMKLTRAGAAYKGQTVSSSSPCGPGANSFPDPVTLKVQIRVNTARGQGQAWNAASLTGGMVGISQYVSSGSYYCPASTFKTSVSGSLG
jgi:hypothetical protein